MEKKKGRRRETTTRRESVLTVSNLKDEKFKNNKLLKKNHLNIFSSEVFRGFKLNSV